MKVPQVRTRSNVGQVALKGVQATGDDFGGQFAQPLAQAGNAINEFALKEFQAANIAAVQEAESGLYQWENDSLYGDNGLYKRKGKDAMGASDELLTGFDKYTQEVMSTLTNDQQRNAFRRSMESRRRDLMNTSSRYQFAELQSYKEQQSQAYIANSQIAAANNYQDPSRVNEEINRQVDSIRATANANGTSPEATKLLIESTISTTHQSVIERALSNKEYGFAKSYFDRNKDNILPDKRDSIKSQITIGDVRATSQSYTDNIFGSGVDEKTALKQAREISNPEVRDQVVQRLKIRYEEQAEEQKAFLSQNFNNAANIIEQTGDPDSVPPEVWANLSITQRNAIDARAEQLRKGEDPSTDWKVWTNLNEMPDEQLANVNLWEYRSQLSNKHYQDFHNEQQKIKEEIEKGQKNPSLSSTLTFKDRTKQVATAAGIIPAGKTPTKWSDDEALRYGQFQTEASSRIEAYEFNKGSKATGEEVQRILDEMVVESVKVKQFWSDKELFTYEVTEDEKGDSYVPYSEIPSNETETAKNLLKSRGLSPTKKRIERLYAAMLLGDKLLADQILEGN